MIDAVIDAIVVMIIHAMIVVVMTAMIRVIVNVVLVLWSVCARVVAI